MAGILGQELLGRSPEWFNVGAEPQWMPDSALTAIEFFIVGHFEVKRFQGWNKHKTVRPALTPQAIGLDSGRSSDMQCAAADSHITILAMTLQSCS